MAALPGGTHPAGAAAEPMQVDHQPHPAAAGAAPADAKVRAASLLSAAREVVPERSRRQPDPSVSFSLPPLVFGGLYVRSAGRSAPRAARLGRPLPHPRTGDLSLSSVGSEGRSFAWQGGGAAPGVWCGWALRARYASPLLVLDWVAWRAAFKRLRKFCCTS
jgi:hypothetical protein